MSKIKITKKQEKINKNINKLKEMELANINSIKESVSDCIDHLYNKKSYFLIFIGSDDLDDKMIIPCFVSGITVTDDKTINLKVDFILNGENRTIIAPFYEMKSVSDKQENIVVGVCRTENDCRKIYNHFLDLKIKHINSYRMKLI